MSLIDLRLGDHIFGGNQGVRQHLHRLDPLPVLVGGEGEGEESSDIHGGSSLFSIFSDLASVTEGCKQEGS